MDLILFYILTRLKAVFNQLAIPLYIIMCLICTYTYLQIVAMRKHLDEQIVTYGQQVVINLVSSSKIINIEMCRITTDFHATTLYVSWENFHSRIRGPTEHLVYIHSAMCVLGLLGILY